MRAYETKVSGFELVGLGKEVERTAQAHLNLIMNLTGGPPPKLKSLPFGEDSKKALGTTAEGSAGSRPSNDAIEDLWK
jgi:hypothetical protein